MSLSQSGIQQGQVLVVPIKYSYHWNQVERTISWWIGVTITITLLQAGINLRLDTPILPRECILYP
ncbi:MAG: hypothetical protein ACFFCI_04105 [Promethearchaeota archaeon]